jgi:hypothetical protein
MRPLQPSPPSRRFPHDGPGRCRRRDLWPRAGPARLHPPPADEGSTVIITGIRASLESALTTKREDAGIVDVIKAEDIAKFPDTNLAESLQRIPGVVIDRDAGEGRNITVRGLGGLHARAHQRHRGAGHHRRHRQLRRQQPQPRFRLQRLRGRTVQQHHGAQERHRPTSTKARSAPRSTCTIAAVRLQGLHGHRRRSRAATTTWSESTDPRVAFLIGNTWANRTWAWCSRPRTPSAGCSKRASPPCVGTTALVGRLVCAHRRHRQPEHDFHRHHLRPGGPGRGARGR